MGLTANMKRMLQHPFFISRKHADNADDSVRMKEMENLKSKTPYAVIVDSDFHNADHLITELDEVIQQTNNMELSRQLNEISDSYQSISDLIKNLEMT